MTDLQQKLEKLRNRPTSYELAISHPDGRKFRVLYGPKKTRSALLNYLRQKVDDVIRVTGQQEPEVHFGKKVADGGTIGEWKVAFTGRTKRDALIEGELPWISGT